jgi:hypothetical protein
MTGLCGQKSRTTKVRLDEGKATSSGATRSGNHGFHCPGQPSRLKLVATEAREGQNRAITSGIRGMSVSIPITGSIRRSTLPT